MSEFIYKKKNVREALHPFFEQLAQEFGAKYEIWVREENFSRTVSAAVVSKNTDNVAIIKIQTNSQLRSYPFQSSEVQRIHAHMASSVGMTELHL